MASSVSCETVVRSVPLKGSNDVAQSENATEKRNKTSRKLTDEDSVGLLLCGTPNAVRDLEFGVTRRNKGQRKKKTGEQGGRIKNLRKVLEVGRSLSGSCGRISLRQAEGGVHNTLARLPRAALIRLDVGCQFGLLIL